jgi:hypothetical protein
MGEKYSTAPHNFFQNNIFTSLLNEGFSRRETFKIGRTLPIQVSCSWGDSKGLAAKPNITQVAVVSETASPSSYLLLALVTKQADRTLF